MKVWIVGKWIRDYSDTVGWEFQGVFSSYEKAVAACVNRDFFVGPAVLDAELPFEKHDWVDCKFPLRGE